MGRLKITISFSQRETITANESVLSKDVKVVPIIKDLKFKDEDGRIIKDAVKRAFGEIKGHKRILKMQKGLV